MAPASALSGLASPVATVSPNFVLAEMNPSFQSLLQKGGLPTEKCVPHSPILDYFLFVGGESLLSWRSHTKGPVVYMVMLKSSKQGAYFNLTACGNKEEGWVISLDPLEPSSVPNPNENMVLVSLSMNDSPTISTDAAGTILSLHQNLERLLGPAVLLVGMKIQKVLGLELDGVNPLSAAVPCEEYYVTKNCVGEEVALQLYAKKQSSAGVCSCRVRDLTELYQNQQTWGVIHNLAKASLSGEYMRATGQTLLFVSRADQYIVGVWPDPHANLPTEGETVFTASRGASMTPRTIQTLGPPTQIDRYQTRSRVYSERDMSRTETIGHNSDGNQPFAMTYRRVPEEGGASYGKAIEDGHYFVLDPEDDISLDGTNDNSLSIGNAVFTRQTNEETADPNPVGTGALDAPPVFSRGGPSTGSVVSSHQASMGQSPTDGASPYIRQGSTGAATDAAMAFHNPGKRRNSTSRSTGYAMPIPEVSPVAQKSYDLSNALIDLETSARMEKQRVVHVTCIEVSRSGFGSVVDPSSENLDTFVARDVTAEFYAKKALHSQDILFQSYLEGANEPCVVLNRNLEVVKYNRLLPNILESENIRGQPLFDLAFWLLPQGYTTEDIVESEFPCSFRITRESLSGHGDTTFVLHWIKCLQSLSAGNDDDPAFIVLFENVTVEMDMNQKIGDMAHFTKALTSAANQGIIAANENGVIVSVNKVIEDMFGYGPGRLVGMDVSILISPPYDSMHGDEIRAYLAQKRNPSKKAKPRKLDGKPRDLMGKSANGEVLLLSVSLKEIEDENRTLFFAFITNTKTEREQELEFMETFHKAKAIFDSIEDSIVVIDQNGIIDKVNNGCLKLLGYDSENEMKGNNVTMMMSEIDAEKHSHHMNRYLETGKSVSLGKKKSVSVQTKSGEIVSMMITVSEVRIDNDLMFIGILEDMREKLQKRRQLVAKEERVRAIIEDAVDAIILVNERGTLTGSNRAARDVLGENIASLEQILPEQLYKFYVSHMQIINASDGNPSESLETIKELQEFVYGDGTFLEITISCSFVGDRAQYIGILKNITKRKQLEAALQASKDSVHNIIAGAADGIVSIDEFGTVLNYNRQAMAIFKFPPEEVEGKNCTILMPNPYCHEHDEYLRMHKQSNRRLPKGFQRITRGRRKDGSTFNLKLGISEVISGSQHLFMAVMQDVTGKQEQEEDRVGILTRKELLVGMISDPLVIISANGLVCEISPAVYGALGWEKTDELEAEFKKTNIHAFTGKRCKFLSQKNFERNEDGEIKFTDDDFGLLAKAGEAHALLKNSAVVHPTSGEMVSVRVNVSLEKMPYNSIMFLARIARRDVGTDTFSRKDSFDSNIVADAGMLPMSNNPQDAAGIMNTAVGLSNRISARPPTRTTMRSTGSLPRHARESMPPVQPPDNGSSSSSRKTLSSTSSSQSLSISHADIAAGHQLSSFMGQMTMPMPAKRSNLPSVSVGMGSVVRPRTPDSPRSEISETASVSSNGRRSSRLSTLEGFLNTASAVNGKGVLSSGALEALAKVEEEAKRNSSSSGFVALDDESRRFLQKVRDTLELYKMSFRDRLLKVLHMVAMELQWPIAHFFQWNCMEGRLFPTVSFMTDIKRFQPFHDITVRAKPWPGLGLPGKTFAAKELVFIVDVTKAPNFPRAKAAAEAGIRAGVALPVPSGNSPPNPNGTLEGRDLVGVIELFSDCEHHGDPRATKILQEVAEFVGRAYTNSQ